MITITLDSVKKSRGKKEWRSVNRASACGMESVSDGNVIVSLARMLSDTMPDDAVQVVRAGTICFSGNTLHEWASGKVLTGEQPDHLRRKR